MTSDLNQQTNTQSIQQEKETPYHETKEYQDKMFAFINETQQHFKKDTTDMIARARANRYGIGRGINLQFTPENVQLWLQAPATNEAILRQFSSFLYDSNALYRWAITTMGNMPTWSWVLSMETYGKSQVPDKKEKMYRQGIKYINDKNIPYEMNKAFLIALKHDFFYGYEVEEDGYYFVLNLDPDYCRINRQVGDGVFGFQFNFSFFSGRLNVDEREEVLKSYPLEFRRKYAEYLSGRYEDTWIDLDVENTICLKMNDEIYYGLPYYADLFPLLGDLGFYKDMARRRAEIDNFLLLHQYIPIDDKALDKFAINLPLAKSFDAIANSILPEGVNMFTSPMKIDAVKTERSTNDDRNVKNATSQVFTGMGIPQQLSNTEDGGASGIAKAIMVNEQIVYRFYRQVEKVYNYKLKNKFASTRFQFRIQDITNFNKEEKINSLLKTAQNGIGSPMAVASASGTNPYQFMNDVDLEYDVLGLTHKLRPLQTSHTISGNDVEAHASGAPQKNDKDLSDSGDVARNNDTNNRDM